MDAAFENHMREESGLKFPHPQAADFRSFVNAEWEMTMKRVFAGDEAQEDYYVKPPPKAFPWLARVRGTTDRYTLKRCAAPPPLFLLLAAAWPTRGCQC